MDLLTARASHKLLEEFGERFHTLDHPLSEDEYQAAWSQLRPLLVGSRS